jgi:uncharacterized membrane protein HdeD (DUF308 family)
MNTAIERPPIVELRQVQAALRGNWVWFVLLGALLLVLGTVALASPWVMTLATAVAIGVLLLVGGVAETLGAFWSRHWSGVFVHLISGLLSVIVGLMFVWAPADAALASTLPLACLLMLGGVAKVAAALNFRFAAWGWPLVSGLIDLALGTLILLEWPVSGFWVIGVFVGINLLFRGLNWMGLGIALATLPSPKVN